jgi:DNA-binding IclR family transcriptional regulator
MEHERAAAAGAGAVRSGTSGARTVQSLERAFLILERIAGSEAPPSLADLSRATGLHTSTAFHLLKTLVHLGYVRQDDDRRYRVGTRLFVQAAAAFDEVTLVDLAMPFLRRLAEETGETTHLAVRADSGIAVIAKADATASVRASERVGIVRPAHATGIGKVLLAALTADERERFLAAARLEAYTPNTIVDPDVLRREIERVAADGIAYDDAEFNREVRCIAAPVRNFSRQTVAAIGISGPLWRVTLQALPRLSGVVASTAHALSESLGGRAG